MHGRGSRMGRQMQEGPQKKTHKEACGRGHCWGRALVHRSSMSARARFLCSPQPVACAGVLLEQKEQARGKWQQKGRGKAQSSPHKPSHSNAESPVPPITSREA